MFLDGLGSNKHLQRVIQEPILPEHSDPPVNMSLPFV